MSHAAKEQRLRQINARFRAATPGRFRRRWRLSVPMVLAGVAILGLAGAVLLLLSTRASDVAMEEMSAGDRARHLLAAPNCSAARLVRLAPAYRGEPGYWPDHDADRDGVACEPLPKAR